MYSQNAKLVKDDLFIVEANVMGEEKKIKSDVCVSTSVFL